MFDFACTKCEVVFEDLVPSDQHEAACKCGGTGTRQISNVRLDWRAMGVDPDFSTCSGKWEKMQREKARKDNHNLVMY